MMVFDSGLLFWATL